MSLFPFAEHLIDDRYTSEEEDYYSPETYAAARAECCHLSPDGEVDEDTVYAAVIRHPVEGISVFVPSYRSKLVRLHTLFLAIRKTLPVFSLVLIVATRDIEYYIRLLFLLLLKKMV